MDLDALNRRFAIEGARFEIGQGGLTRLVMRTPQAEAEIYVQGAHVTKFNSHSADGEPILFLSKQAIFKEGKAIRGGVPICFPWFGPRSGDASAPAHGFARTMPWMVESVAGGEAGAITATFVLSADDNTRKLWPFDFMARYAVTTGERLHLSLEVTNNSPNAFGFEEALHTYLSVSDIHSVVVHGLVGTTYLDKLNASHPTPQIEPIRFAGETDRVYLYTPDACRVEDSVGNRVLIVEKSGSNSTVVWNPWIEKSRGFKDLADDEWPTMVCIETCNVAENSVSLAPGSSHRMTATIASETKKQ